jgi:hypothetical protein
MRTGHDFDYTPDTVVQTLSGRLLCVECKFWQEAQAPDIRRKHAEVRVRLEQSGIGFVVVTDSDLANEATGLNAKDLVRGLRTPIAKGANEALRRQIAESRPKTFGALVDLAGCDMALVALSRGLTHFDTRQRLSTSTPLAPFQVQFDAAHFLFA